MLKKTCDKLLSPLTKQDMVQIINSTKYGIQKFEKSAFSYDFVVVNFDTKMPEKAL